MSRKKLQADASRMMAEKMAAGWTDEFLLGKTPEDLMRAYGCSFDQAERVLNNQLTRRKLRR
jgi:hypothetical protein